VTYSTEKSSFPCRLWEINHQYVVTSKWTTGAPEYQLRIRNWNDSPKVTDDSFRFKPSGGAKEVKLSDINAEVLLPETLKGAKR
jgi:hypothetical protein